MSPTIELIESITLSSNTATVTFSNIPQTYDDLYLLVSSRNTDATASFGFENLVINFNNSSSNFSVRVLRNLDGSVSSAAYSSGFIGDSPNTNATSNTYGNAEIYIPGYTTSNNKSFSVTNLTESNGSIGTDISQYLVAGLWSSTNAISSISFNVGTDSFTASSTFELYGIKDADDGAEGYFGPAAQGGDEVFTTGDGYKVHVFKTSGTLTVTNPGEVECLVVAGGGGGGYNFAGGGGAGGLINETLKITSPSNYSVIVGAGGNSGTSTIQPGSGSNSSLISKVAIGGGAGGSRASGGNNDGSNGGSGGGATADGYNGGLGVSGQGNDGGGGNPGNSYQYAGGGGGAASSGGVGGNTYNVNGIGGNGASKLISGTSTYYAGGGGSGAFANSVNNTPAPGGLGGGGNGGGRVSGTNIPATSGSANTGGGGGGGIWGTTSNGGAGGSGIVIIRYKI